MLSRSEVNGGTHILYRIPIEAPVNEEAALKELCQQIETVYRTGGEHCTLWLDVVEPIVPRFALKALETLNGLPAGPVLTLGNYCSHGPTGRLPEAVLHAVAGMARDGRVWHPQFQRMVPAMPEYVV